MTITNLKLIFYNMKSALRLRATAGPPRNMLQQLVICIASTMSNARYYRNPEFLLCHQVRICCALNSTCKRKNSYTSYLAP